MIVSMMEENSKITKEIKKKFKPCSNFLTKSCHKQLEMGNVHKNYNYHEKLHETNPWLDPTLLQSIREIQANKDSTPLKHYVFFSRRKNYSIILAI
jgi:hypothetical protein